MCWKCRELEEYKAELEMLLADVDEPIEMPDHFIPDLECEDEEVVAHLADSAIMEKVQEAWEESVRERELEW